MKRTALLIALVAVVVILSWQLLPKPLPETDLASLVSLQQGQLAGIVDDYDSYAWLGIPYAAPPVDALRWRAPVDPPAWSDIRHANQFGDFCMQLANGQTTLASWRWGQPVGSEDCLYLNIWAPQAALRDATPRPVMLWIHGGGNTIGHAGIYHGARLAGEQDVVVVTINYRMGALGWFSHPALRATSSSAEDASGNYGTLDMIQALRWVKDNINSFGGDPHRVTIFGESAGGRNVVSLLAAPGAGGLFHRAIIQSGLTESVSREQAENIEPGYPGNSSWVLRELLVQSGQAADHETAATQLAQRSPESISEWLRGLSAAELLSAYPSRAFGMYYLPQLIRDGTVLPNEDFLELFSDPERYNAVPIITGTNRDEMKLFLLGDERLYRMRFGILPRVVDAERLERENEYQSGKWTASAVTEFAERISKSQDEIWAYRFDWDQGRKSLFMDAAEVFGASHGLDLPFVFGDFESALIVPGLFGEENIEGAEWLAQRMMSYWAAFARDGYPSRGAEGQYPPWLPWNNSSDDHYLVLDTPDSGGIRMAGELIHIDTLKQNLKADPRYANNEERCKTYRDMFERSRYWSNSEYRALGCLN